MLKRIVFKRGTENEIKGLSGFGGTCMLGYSYHTIDGIRDGFRHIPRCTSECDEVYASGWRKSAEAIGQGSVILCENQFQGAIFASGQYAAAWGMIYDGTDFSYVMSYIQEEGGSSDFIDVGYVYNPALNRFNSTQCYSEAEYYSGKGASREAALSNFFHQFDITADRSGFPRNSFWQANSNIVSSIIYKAERTDSYMNNYRTDGASIKVTISSIGNEVKPAENTNSSDTVPDQGRATKWKV